MRFQFSRKPQRMNLLINIHVPSSFTLIRSIFLLMNTITQSSLIWITIQISILN